MDGVMELWNDFEASTVEGRYPLGRLVRTEGRRAWFETQLDSPDAHPALIILTESLNDEDVLLERLHAVRQIRHPNLVAVLDCGVTTLKDTPLVYAVTERTEENLEDVLRERPLSSEEALQLLDGLLGGLTAIHARKLHHGRLEAANVLAAGDTIKLRSDCIRLVPSGESLERLAAEDVRGLGTILFQSLTLRQPQSAQDPAIRQLPAPFAYIVQLALTGNGTIAEIEHRLGRRPASSLASGVAKPVVPAVTAKPAAAPQPTAAPQQNAVPQPEQPAAKPALPSQPAPQQKVEPQPEQPAAKPALPSQPALPLQAAAVDKPQPPAASAPPATPPTAPVARAPIAAEPLPLEDEADDTAEIFPPLWKRSPWIIGAFVVLVLVSIWIAFAILHGPEKQTATVTNQPQQPATSLSAPSRDPGTATEARQGKGSQSPAAVARAEQSRPANGAQVWRVVVYTYNRRDQAEHKAQTLAAKHADLNPEVFAPRGDRAPYLVTVGGPMDREDAFRMRARARRLGLARDTFARNYR
jgi:eukaryotic-like serine/threonine-protein kinase